MTIPTPAAPCPDCGAAMQDRGAGLECPACGHVQGWEPLAVLPCPGCATRSTDGADHTCYRTCPECGAPLDDQGDFRQCLVCDYTHYARAEGNAP